MNIARWTLRGAVLVTALLVGAERLTAQGVTTGAISGIVSNEQGAGVAGAQVQVVNVSTGARTGATTNADGRYFVQSLDVGGPYTVRFRRIGFAAIDSLNVFISLGQNYRLNAVLRAQAAQIAGVQIVGTTSSSVISASHKGVADDDQRLDDRAHCRR